MTFRILLKFNGKEYRARVKADTAAEAKRKVLESVKFIEIEPEIPNPFEHLFKK